MNKNIFGDPLITCSQKPLTGYFRNGCCDTDDTDLGIHTVCIIATKEFLKFSKEAGNDLTTPLPEFGFDGGKLKELCDVSLHVKTPVGEFGPVEDIHMILDHLITTWFCRSSSLSL